MDCNTPVSWDAIIRNAARVSPTDPTCYALAIRDGDASGSPDCNHPPLLTMFAGAWDTNAILVDSSSAPYDALTCDDDVSPISLAMAAIFTGTANSVAIVEDAGIDTSCGMSCDDTEATSAMIAGTFVKVAAKTRTLVNVVTGFGPIDCDGADVGIETILRGALIKVSPGHYAWRVTDGGASPPQPFLCAGPGYGILVVGPGGCLPYLDTTTGHYAARRISDGVIFVDPDSVGPSYLLEEGTYCMYASDEFGAPSGSVLNMYANGDMVTWGVSGYSGMNTFTFLSTTATVMPDVSTIIGLEYYNPGSPLVSVIPSISANVNLRHFVIGAMLPLITDLPSFRFNVLLFDVQIVNLPSITESTVATRLQELIDYNANPSGLTVLISGCGTPPSSWITKGATLTSMGATVTITA